jgi:hypothetical protein
MAALLGDDWQVQMDERRPREAPARAGPRHTHDVVLRSIMWVGPLVVVSFDSAKRSEDTWMVGLNVFSLRWFSAG